MSRYLFDNDDDNDLQAFLDETGNLQLCYENQIVC